MFLITEEEIRRLNEVEVDGQPVGDDADNPEPPTDYTTPDPINAAGADNPPADPAPAEDAPPPEDGDDIDYTQDTDAPPPDDTGENPPPDDGGGDDIDYTQGGDDYGAEGGDPPPDDGGAAPTGGDGQVTADDARGMENELFKDLTPDQIDIKHQELKSNFTELYDSTTNIIDRINDIPSNDDYLATIAFVSEQLNNLRTMVADYMNKVYSTKSYMENAMNYNRFLATLKGINDILSEISNDLDAEEPK